MWKSHTELGNATWELAGEQDATPAPVYLVGDEYGKRAAHGLALIPTHPGQHWPPKQVDGYLNMLNLCQCPENNPHSCSAY
jgi:hypothetical protein